MMFSFEARTRELLRHIWLTGTLSGAATKIGMDAGNAGRHLRTAERRAGVRLVERRAGGRGGHNAKLTPAGRRYLDLDTRRGLALEYDAREGFTPIRIGGRSLFGAGRIPAGPVEIELRPDSVALERTPRNRAASSVRNRFRVRVARIEEVADGVFRIGLSAGSLSFDSLVVRGAVRDLKLQVGSRLYATIKAVSIHAAARRP